MPNPEERNIHSRKFSGACKCPSLEYCGLGSSGPPAAGKTPSEPTAISNRKNFLNMQPLFRTAVRMPQLSCSPIIGLDGTERKETPQRTTMNQPLKRRKNTATAQAVGKAGNE